MTGIKRIIKIIIIVIILFPCLYFTAVLIGGLIFTGGGETGESGDVVIYLENNGRHIDVWLPVEVCGYPAASWLSFGWGDRDFYLQTPFGDDLNLRLMMKALFVPSRGVIAMDLSENEPSSGDLKRLSVSREQARAAWNFISSYFIQEAASGDFEKISAALVHPSYGSVEFFEAKGRYSLFYTCNNWTGGVLKAAGVSTGLWTPLTFGVYKN